LGSLFFFSPLVRQQGQVECIFWY